MNIILEPKQPKKEIKLPSSKAVAHRAIVCASLSKGKTVLKNVNMCDDIKNTINILREIVNIDIDGTTLIVNGGIKEINKKHFQIDESGSTLRFLLPLLTYFGKDIEISIGKRLLERTIDELIEFFKINGSTIKVKNQILYIDKLKKKDIYEIPTNTTSQLLSGFLMILPYMNGSKLKVTDYVVSKKYIETTTHVMEKFGVNLKCKNNTFTLENSNIYKSIEYTIPNDSDFELLIETINILKNKTNINILNETDEIESNIINSLIEQSINDNLLFDLKNNPDTIFMLSMYSILSNKQVVFVNFERLLSKETNRIETCKKLIDSVGGTIEYLDNKMIVKKACESDNNTFDSFNDHRIVYALLLYSIIKNKKIKIKNIDCINKSLNNPEDFLKELNFKFQTEQTVERMEYNFDNQKTKILFGKGTTSYLQEYFTSFTKYVVVIDKNIPSKHIEYLKKSFLDNASYLIYKTKFTGEKIKSLNEYENLIGFLLKNNISKTDYLLSFGGGCTTDLTAFAASTYKRGMNLIHIPTSLIAQCDAAIGSKTALNVNETKNSIGSFYSPKAIIIDTNYLETIKKEDKKSGIAEIIKIAAITDVNMFYDIYDSQTYEKIEKWLYKAIVHKIKYVNIDPYDKKERHALNFGHTIAHSLELKNNLSHGEAVAIGMYNSTKNIYLKNIIKKYGFYTETDINCNFNNDKKIEHGILKYIIINEIGSHEIIDKKI